MTSLLAQFLIFAGEMADDRPDSVFDWTPERDIAVSGDANSSHQPDPKPLRITAAFVADGAAPEQQRHK